MSDPVFAPKITHRIAGVYIDEGQKTMTPWQRLRDWERADKTQAQSTIEYITLDMQHRYPGRYHIAKRVGPRQGWESYYTIVFDDPAEETWFRLKYPG